VPLDSFLRPHPFLQRKPDVRRGGTRVQLQTMNRGNQIIARRAARGGFFVFRQGEEDGPFPLDELEEMHRGGELPASTPCRGRTDKEWHDLGYILRSQEEGEPRFDQPLEGPVTSVCASEKPVSREGGVGLSAQAASVPGNEVSVRALVAELIAVTQRQNRLLAGIKWSLIGLTLAIAATGATVAVFAL
jgi:hypothetical protein